MLMFPQHLHIQALHLKKQREVIRNSFVLSFIFLNRHAFIFLNRLARPFLNCKVLLQMLVIWICIWINNVGKWYLLTLSIYLCGISHWDTVFKAISAFISVDNALCFHGRMSNALKVQFNKNYKCICSGDLSSSLRLSLYLLA